MSKRIEYAERYFGDFNCSQTVLTAFCEELGLDREAGLKVSCAFGGGLSHNDSVCGAVTGALMVIGLKYGKFLAEDTAARDRTYALAREFIARFKSEFGSISCTDLIHYNLSSAEDYAKAREAGVFKSVCMPLVKRAIEIVEEII
jgi:C_GCAxxG_C_C family probable redox protein